MIEILIENCYSYFHKLPPELLSGFQTALNVDTSGLVRNLYARRGQPKYIWKSSQWSPIEQDSSNLIKIPTGLLWRALKTFDSERYPFAALDERKNVVDPCRTPEEVCEELGLQPRAYQLDSVRAIHNHQRGYLNIATNGGKTEILSLIINTYPKCCSFVITAQLTGVSEISERFEKRGVPCNIIDSKNKTVDFSGVNVCSLDSVKNSKDFNSLLQNAKILIWDECDDSATASTGELIGTSCEAYVRIYLSGTPVTDNQIHNTKLVGYSGEELVRISNSYLISEEYSAKPLIKFHTSHYSNLPIPSTYQNAVKSLINENEEFAERVATIASEVQDEGVVVLYEHRKHGDLLLEKFKKLGVGCVRVDGSSSVQSRKRATEDLEYGRVSVILASSIWNRALDFGYPEHWFIVGGMKASNRIKQKYGRALRKKKNKDNTVTIYEWYIRGHKKLEEHSKKRFDICINEGFEIELVDEQLGSVFNYEGSKKNT